MVAQERARPLTEVQFAGELGVAVESLVAVAAGVYARDLTTMTGDRPRADTIVAMRFRAWDADGKPLPASTRTVNYRLGDGAMLPGFDKALAGMSVNGRRQIVLVRSEAYEGTPSLAGLPEVVVFEVTLLEAG
jgi:FKBP-type peptidyl-prolyl cis-trans isomerase